MCRVYSEARRAHPARSRPICRVYSKSINQLHLKSRRGRTWQEADQVVHLAAELAAGQLLGDVPQAGPARGGGALQQPAQRGAREGHGR